MLLYYKSGLYGIAVYICIYIRWQSTASLTVLLKYDTFFLTAPTLLNYVEKSSSSTSPPIQSSTTTTTFTTSSRKSVITGITKQDTLQAERHWGVWIWWCLTILSTLMNARLSGMVYKLSSVISWNYFVFIFHILSLWHLHTCKRSHTGWKQK